jgi:hypothetical protein
VATVAGKEVNRSLELDKIMNVVHAALDGNEEREGTQSESSSVIPEDQSKTDVPGGRAGAGA